MREPVYLDRHPTLAQKAAVYWHILTHRFACGLASDDRQAPDLYHLLYQPYPLSSWLSGWLPEFRRRPTLHTVPATADHHRLTRRLFFADRVVAISKHGQRRLERLGLENVAYIPPGIWVEPWQALHDRKGRLKARANLEGRPVVLFPGHYSLGQGAEVMADALPQLVAEVANVCVLFACRPRSPFDLERERVLQRRLADAGLMDNIRFYHTVADMGSLIGSSDVVALPLETMHDKLDIPLTLLESLAAGKPIVVSDLAPMHELLLEMVPHVTAEESIGHVVPPGDAKALAQALIALLTDSLLYERMVQRAQTLVQQRFDIRRVAQQYDRLYLEMGR